MSERSLTKFQIFVFSTTLLTQKQLQLLIALPISVRVVLAFFWLVLLGRVRESEHELLWKMSAKSICTSFPVRYVKT